jgi:hypothetical protein
VISGKALKTMMKRQPINLQIYIGNSDLTSLIVEDSGARKIHLQDLRCSAALSRAGKGSKLESKEPPIELPYAANRDEKASRRLMISSILLIISFIALTCSAFGCARSVKVRSSKPTKRASA